MKIVEFGATSLLTIIVLLRSSVGVNPAMSDRLFPSPEVRRTELTEQTRATAFNPRDSQK
jgi:hypothetical protein